MNTISSAVIALSVFACGTAFAQNCTVKGQKIDVEVGGVYEFGDMKLRITESGLREHIWFAELDIKAPGIRKRIYLNDEGPVTINVCGIDVSITYSVADGHQKILVSTF